ncbi:MAG: hypothetical protein JXP36_19050 [Bacteroidales bacterium]|nr:hypothetical protein [Bacteroidales bacterium]
MIKKLLIHVVSILFFTSPLYAQYIPTENDMQINDIVNGNGQYYSPSLINYSEDYNFFNDFNNWIPYNNDDPLKNPPIKTIEITFHVFLDDDGGNSNYTNTTTGKNRLLYLFNTLNKIYSGGWGPSDPIEGIQELPSYDSRIRFSLGENNERIYFYNDSSLNNSYSNSTFYNYLKSNYPDRVNNLNIYFTASHYLGKVESANVEIINGGTGYTSAPTITFSPPSATATATIENGSISTITVTNKGGYYSFNPPSVIVSGGGGTGAEIIVNKLSGGGTGYAILPSLGISRDHYVVMLHCYESSDWVWGFTLAHELAHDLDLLHTYCGGGATVVCCSGSCATGCIQNCNASEYLSDIFGDCPGTCPHLANWGNPYSTTIANPEKVTNNVMGGSTTQVYFSPMQVGQMHRAMSLKSCSKYVSTNAPSTKEFNVIECQDWDFYLKVYNKINVVGGAILTINNTLALSNTVSITVKNGSALIINGTINLVENNSIIVEDGGTLVLNSGGNTIITNNGHINCKAGSYFCIEEGANIILQDNLSTINLHPGYISGVNTSVVTESTNCVSNPASITFSGNGSINTQFSQDVYIQNTTFTTDSYITGKNIYVGREVTTTMPTGDVIINNNANVIFDAEENVFFHDGFKVEKGSSFENKK